MHKGVDQAVVSTPFRSEIVYRSKGRGVNLMAFAIRAVKPVN